ncbi:MAG: fused MFS/spermidine synthase [Phycisphaerae bacterium]
MRCGVRQAVLYVLFLLSGAAGLVYELVWVRQLVFVFGGTTYAITTVLVAFMAGLGLGSYLGGRWCRRLEAPGRVYGLLEIGIGAYALLVPWLLTLAEPLYRGLYPHVAEMPALLTALRFAASGLVLLIPTTCMGATLPILVRHVTLAGGRLGQSVGHLYGINTFGAVLGVLAAGLWLIPTFGLRHTTWLAAAVNAAIGLTALVWLWRPVRSRPVPATTAGDEPSAPPLTPGVRAIVLVAFAVSGFAAMVYQITWTRALIMSLGSSTYSFTCILAAFILGLALGSLIVARWADRWTDPVLILGGLELAIGLIAVLIVPLHGYIPLFVRSLVAEHYQDYGALLRWEFLLVLAVTIVPTLLMGAIFPLVIRALAGAGDEAGAVTGRAYAVNTLGTIAGSFLAGFVLIRSDVLGVQSSIVLASALNGVAGAALWFSARPTAGSFLVRRLLLPAGVLVLIPVVAVGAGRWDPRLLTIAPYFIQGDVEKLIQHREVVYYGEGVDMTVAVLQSVGHAEHIALTVNGKPDASTGPRDMTTQLLLGHVPALVAGRQERACVIGLGSGMTLAALARYPEFRQLDCVEISDEVIKAAALFAPYTYHVLTDDPRVRMVRADGRNHLLLTDVRYDVIISEPSNPWIAGVSNLFTREFFELSRARLTDDGLLAVWLHGYMMSVDDFRMVVRTLFDVYGSVSLWKLTSNDYLMMASPSPQAVDVDELLRRFELPAVRADLYRIGLHRPAHILGRYVAGDEALRAWCADAPIHTDDNALLEFSCPRYLYSGQEETLATEFDVLQGAPLEDLLADGEAAAPPDLRAETAGVVAARRACRRSREAWARGETARSLRIRLDGYRLDPCNLDLAMSIGDARAMNAAPSAEVAELLEALGNLWPAVFAPVRGASLAEIAEGLRQYAAEASEAGQPEVALDYLRQAWRIEPGDRRTLVSLAACLAQTGATEEALAVLRAGLASGQVQAEELKADERLGPLTTQPAFEALLNESP